MWSLATIRPNGEKQVGNLLDRKRVDHHIFRVRSKIARGGQVIEVLRPVFPRCVFVPLTRCGKFRHGIDGVIGVVCFGLEAAVVPEAVTAAPPIIAMTSRRLIR
jgi:hypothetical protein